MRKPAIALLFAATLASARGPAVRPVPVVFSGGHETDLRDGGRPVSLIAAALGVPRSVFRDAFSRVHPARGGEPTFERIRDNKAALLGTLSKYGVTNRRLDEVSDHYRYRRERGETWPGSAAKAFALVEGGRVVGFEATDAGSGYSSVPMVTVPGFPALRASAAIAYDRRFEKKGSVTSIIVLRR